MDTPNNLSESVQALFAAMAQHEPSVPSHWYLREIGVDFDVDSQLGAIQGLLKRNKAAEVSLAGQIKEAEQEAAKLDGSIPEYPSAYAESLVQDLVFQDAAHSMAAVGMLAPFLETVFTQCFRGIGNHSSNDAPSAAAPERWQSSHAIRWDCHNFIANGRSRPDLVKGILQLADAIGLRPRLPEDLEGTLSALFGYRNKMFHCGFEWPAEERTAFQNRIDSEKWPKTWFATARSDGKPWIFYLTDEFIEHCLKTTNLVLTAFGEFVRDEMRTAQTPEAEAH